MGELQSKIDKLNSEKDTLQNRNKELSEIIGEKERYMYIAMDYMYIY